MRAFIAIELPDDVRSGLATIQGDLKQADADVKWVEPANVHLTLKFLGNVPDDKIPRIKNILDSVSRGYKKFESSLFKVGAFPKVDYPRVLWVGIDKNCSIIEEITAKIEDECEKIGFAKEDRAFSAHLTIGRVRSPKNKAALKERLISTSVEPMSFTIDKIILFQSTLARTGPIYTPLHTSLLG